MGRTRYYTIDYGWTRTTRGFKSESIADAFFLVTPQKTLEESLEELTQYFVQNQLRCQSRNSPNRLTGAGKHVSNGGWDYGLTQITWFVVLAQREEEITEEGYARRKKKQEIENHVLPKLTRKFEELQEQAGEYAKLDTNIAEKKSLLFGSTFHVAGREFSSCESAEEYARQFSTTCEVNLDALRIAAQQLEEARQELEALDP